jgi:hypothetical protein
MYIRDWRKHLYTLHVLRKDNQPLPVKYFCNYFIICFFENSISSRPAYLSLLLYIFY